ncbi:sortase-like acyltransferase [Pseudomonas asplenii]|uniref:Sortase-like acyltransferase n=1 Tax=Pseudomonas asplenii TaxID=53407 RepID=A0A0M9GDH3_9PSED|nr:GNAT family N-acetyltransferase [Pseudomonas fuscovaginae]KPA88255.1 sortase-like acyltransferase [Pseudomonas fuscovaginae]
MPAIRPARPDDIPALAAVERSAASIFREVGLGWVAEGEPLPADYLEQLCRHRTLWVATDADDQPVGFLAAETMDRSFFIVELSVHAVHQKLGLGTALMAAAIAHARAELFATVSLTTYRHLRWNAPFYARLGFVEVEAASLGEEHVAQLQHEVDLGHDAGLRCAMVLRLKG